MLFIDFLAAAITFSDSHWSKVCLKRQSIRYEAGHETSIQCDTGFPEFIGLVDPVVSKIQRVSQILITVVRDLVVSKFDDFRVPMVYPTSDSDSSGFPCVLAAFQTACV